MSNVDSTRDNSGEVFKQYGDNSECICVPLNESRELILGQWALNWRGPERGKSAHVEMAIIFNLFSGTGMQDGGQKGEELYDVLYS